MKDKPTDINTHQNFIEGALNSELPLEDTTLTDDELRTAGLVKTTAFVRSKKSKNALRQAKSKEKKAAAGIKQVNVEVPADQALELKTFAAELRSGEKKSVYELGANAQKVLTRGGFRAALLRYLLKTQ